MESHRRPHRDEYQYDTVMVYRRYRGTRTEGYFPKITETKENRTATLRNSVPDPDSAGSVNNCPDPYYFIKGSKKTQKKLNIVLNQMSYNLFDNTFFSTTTKCSGSIRIRIRTVIKRPPGSGSVR